MPAIAKPCQEPLTAASPSGLPPAYHHLYSLLHTLRSLDSRQDEICTLLADIRRTGRLSAASRRELTALLHELPLAALTSEADAVLSALEQ